MQLLEVAIQARKEMALDKAENLKVAATQETPAIESILGLQVALVVGRFIRVEM